VSTVLFVTWDGGGNVNPVLALAPRLAAHGVTPLGFGPPSLAPRFGADGVDYVARDVPDPWDAAAMAADVRAACERTGADLAVPHAPVPRFRRAPGPGGSQGRRSARNRWAPASHPAVNGASCPSDHQVSVP